MKGTRVSLKTIGCKSNYADSSDLASALTDSGYRIVSPEEDADVVIVNSCVVTHRAEGDSRRALLRGKRGSRGALVVLTGCGASPFVSASLKEKADAVVEMNGSLIAAKIAELCGTLPHGEDTGREGQEQGHAKVRARKFIKIQNGCDNSCAYCIVPLARGKSLSSDPDIIVEKVTRAEREGFPEVVLTGTHIGHYGLDDPHYPLLSELLSSLIKSTDKIRIRLSSIEVNEIDSRLVEMIGNEKRVCSHLHIPLQSGDDTILERMRRWYTTGQFGDTLKRLRKISSTLCVGTDIITGFPGETDNQFENTYRFLEEAEIDYFHVFPYSKREGSKAALLDNHVKEKIKRSRTRSLIELGKRKKKAFLGRMVGTRVDIACENVWEGEGKFEGTSGNYMKVVSEGTGVKGGDIVPVVVTGVNGMRAEGIIGR